MAARKTPPAGKTDEATEADAPKVHPAVVILCHVAGGRRRGGYRFEGGANEIAADTFDTDQLEAVIDDPMLSVDQTATLNLSPEEAQVEA